jgi:hypothetical protein
MYGYAVFYALGQESRSHKLFRIRIKFKTKEIQLYSFIIFNTSLYNSDLNI